ncbi:hypothetical protein E3C22_23665 [Jiella endophytica]|uniref:ATP synthase protein I n=1 Tax=Jiella endophytica TaxID=2558362 RepID=A0A4Y8R9B6_9HYPH|nr:AtpZ/AtpI family protein [Jiella endophytica]TFF17659.1 hypothetical protein E3C22_23665 [Jiella endophytica]
MAKDDDAERAGPAAGAADTAAWDARRAALDAKLAEHRARNAAESARERKSGTSQGIAEGLKLASEFVAGIIVGAAIGYGIDRLAGTMPFGLIVFLMIGFAAGVRNVLHSVGPSSSPAPKTSDEPPGRSSRNGES